MSTNQSIQSGLQDHNTAFTIAFEDAIANADPGPYGMWTEDINASGEQRITRAFLANHPRMRKWKGARQHKSLRSYVQSITYEKFEGTLRLKRDMVDYDKTGLVGRETQRFVNLNVVTVYDDFVAQSFDGNSGAGPTGFDDASLFSTVHPHGPDNATTQSNLGTGTNLSHAALVAAESAGGLFQEENGNPLKIVYDTMRVGPRLKRRGQELLSTDRVVIINTDGAADTPRETSSTYQINAAATRTNIFSGDMRLVIDHRVTTYYTTLLDTTKGYKPMTLFKVRSAEPISLTEMTDPQRFEHDDYVYGVEADFGVAAGHWYTVYRMTGTA